MGRYETCDSCGERFDVDDAIAEFEAAYPGESYLDNAVGMCGDCAIAMLEDDEDDDERISVSDAADIWRSHGKDEDYMFGYSEEELEDH